VTVIISIKADRPGAWFPGLSGPYPTWLPGIGGLIRDFEPNELELERIQSHMAQKPVLRGEVGARALRVRLVSREGAWASAGVQGAWVWVCGCGYEAD